MKKLLFLTAVLSLCIAAVQPAEARLGIGDPAPDFTLNDPWGDPHSLSDYQGQVVVLNFWASW